MPRKPDSRLDVRKAICCREWNIAIAEYQRVDGEETGLRLFYDWRSCGYCGIKPVLV